MLDSGNMHEHIATAVIRLDESVSALAIKEFDRAHCHRETPFPVVARRRAPTAGRLGRTFVTGKRRRPACGLGHSTPRKRLPPKRSRTSDPQTRLTHVWRRERGLTA